MTAGIMPLRIVTYPHEALFWTADPVVEITDEVRNAARQMVALMIQNKGAGLAATQVALKYRMFVAKPTPSRALAQVFINPELSKVSDKKAWLNEGCLSHPGLSVPMSRHKRVTITALDLDGNRFKLKGIGFEARVWQHEIDHLNGISISHYERKTA